MSGAQGAASPGGTPLTATASQALLPKDVLLFSRSLIKDKPGDHISEVRFGSPVTLTRIVMGCPAPASDSKQQQPLAPLLRAFARDLLHPGAARYAPLCPNNLSVTVGMSSSFMTEVVVTDHVILRGRYTSVEVQLYGRADYDQAAVVTLAVSGAAASGHPMAPEDVELLRQQQQRRQQQLGPSGATATRGGSCTVTSPGAKRQRLSQAPMSVPLGLGKTAEADECGLGFRAGTGGHGGDKEDREAGLKRSSSDVALLPAPQLIPPGSSLLPLDHVPPALMAALRSAAEYYGEVGRSHGRIAMNPPMGRLGPVMAAAKHVCRALAGQTSDLEMTLATPPPRDVPLLAPGELESLCDMACEWCLLLASGRSSKLEEVNVGMAGVASAVLLAICTPSAPLLMAMGAAGQVVRALCLPNPPADLVRLAVACFDALTLTCPAPAAEVLLAKYRPPPPQPVLRVGNDVAVGAEEGPTATPEVKVMREANGAMTGQPEGEMGASRGHPNGSHQVATGVKSEGTNDNDDGGAVYGDGHVRGEGDDDDEGCEGDDRDRILRRRSSASGVDGGGGDEDGGGEGTEDDDRARLHQTGSGALTRSASGPAVDGEDALMEDELYAGYYDHFDDEYYAGGEEEFVAAEATALTADVGGDGDDNGPVQLEENREVDAEMLEQGPEGASGDNTHGRGDGEDDERRCSSSGGGDQGSDSGIELDSDVEKSERQSGGSPLPGQRRAQDDDGGGVQAVAGDAGTRGEVQGVVAGAQPAVAMPAIRPGEPGDVATRQPDEKQTHSRALASAFTEASKDEGSGGVKDGSGRKSSPREKGNDRDRGRDRDRDRESDRDRNRRERGSSRDRREQRGGERRRRRRGRSKSRSRSRPRSRSRSRSRSGIRSKAFRNMRSRSHSRSRSRSRMRTKSEAKAADALTTTVAAQPPPPPPRQELPPVSAATPLLTVMLRRPRVPAVATAVARVMRRLTVADLVGKCALACQMLVAAAPAAGTSTGGAAAAAAAVMEAMLPLRQLVAILPDLAEAAAAGAVTGAGLGTRIPLLGSALSAKVAQVPSGADGRSLVPDPPALDPPVLQILAARPLFMSLAGALNAVHVHAGLLRKAMETATASATAAAVAGGAEAAAVAAAQQAALYAQSHLQAVHQALLVGLRMLLTPLLSTPGGLALVTAPASRAGVAALIMALDPTAQDAVAIATGVGAPAARRAVTTAATAAAIAAGGGSGSGPAAELAAMLCDALAADVAVRGLVGPGAGGVQHVVVPDQAAIYGAMGPSILTLLHMCAGSEPGRQAAVLALSSSRPALATLLRAVRARPRAARALAAAAAGTGVHAGGDMHAGGRGGLLYDEDDEHDTSFQAESLYASALLLWLVRDTRLQALAGWLPIAGGIADAARVEAELLGSASNSALLGAIGCDAELARRTARELQGRAEAGMALMTGGIAALLRLLEDLLPRLEAAGSGDTATQQQAQQGQQAQQAQQAQQQQQPRLGQVPRGVDVRAAAALVRAGGEQRAASVTASLELLAVLMRGGAAGGRTVAVQLYVQGALGVFERGVRTGIAAVRATAHDTAWAHAGGDALDAGERARNRRVATSLLAAALQATSALLVALRPLAVAPAVPQTEGVAATSGLRLRSRGVVDALLAAHAVTVLSYDSLAAALAGGAAAGTTGVPGAPSGSYELLPARLAVAAALGAWIDASWEPPILPVAFGIAHSYRKDAAVVKAHMGLGYVLSAAGGVGALGDGGTIAESTAATAAAAALEQEPASTSLSPEQGYCLISLLGDLFPREWPPPPTPGQPQSAALPPPTNMSKRSLLASALETVSGQFLRLLSFGYNSESRLVRCATVRMVVKAAGLGGGMPTFLAAPLVEALAALVRGGAGSGTVASAPALTDARRLLEVLAPLAYKATIKAALLDARAVSCLSRFIHKLVSSTIGGNNTAGAAEAAEVPVVTGQALEALRLLADPDLSLSPGAPRETRQREDVPSVAEATAMVTALLSCLPYLGVNASLAAALLAGTSFGLATYPAGRAALRQGAMKWHSAQAGIGASGGSDLARLVEALRWAAGRLRSSAESARSSAAGGGAAAQEGVVLAAACSEVATKLDEVASSTTDADIDTDFPPPQPAPQRFVAAVAAATEAAAVAAAAAVGAAPGSTAAAVIAAADAAEGDPGELGCGGSAGTAWPWPTVCDNATQSFWRYCRARVVRGNVSKKLARWECGAAGTAASVAALLPAEPLSRRRRPRDVPRPAAAAVKPPAPGDGTLAASGGGATAAAAAGRGSGRAADGVVSSTTDDDIPVVTAPRRRGDMRARGSSSRAPSKHVDDYQRMTGAATSPPVATAGAGSASGGSVGGPAPMDSHTSPTGPRVPMGPPPPRPPPPATGGAPLSALPNMGMGMSMGGFRPPSLQPLPSADADSLYDDLFAPTPGSSGGGGPMSRTQSGGGAALQGRSSSGSGQLGGAGSIGASGVGSGGGLPPPPPATLQQPQQRRAQQQQQQQQRQQQQQQRDQGDKFYTGLQSGGQQPMQPMQPMQQQVLAARQQQHFQQQQQAGVMGAGGGSDAAGMTSQHIATLLRDPDKLRTLLATNPALAAIIAKNASNMGLNLPSMQRQ